MLCALHTYYTWSLDVFFHVPFQLPFLEHTVLAAISALGANRTHCHLRPTRYSFTPESSEACKGKVPCPRIQHRNNVPIFGGKKLEIYLKILHQAGIETRTAGCDIGKAPRFNYCAMSLSNVILR